MISIEGIIVNSDGQKRQRVEVDESSGLILRVAEPIGSATLILNDELIFPGFVDIHVHGREDVSHKNDYKEDFISAGEAAINGGVVAFGEMPNCPVPPVDDESYKNRKILTKKSSITIVLYAGIGPSTHPLSKKVPYKVFMGHSIGNLFFNSKEELDLALKKYRGECVSFHCEDPEIMQEHEDEESHERRRPEEAEFRAVDTALEFIEKYNLEGIICHASTIGAIEKIKSAKARGVKVSVEVTPHHLFFDETMFSEKNPIEFQVNPPIRQTKENRIALISALKNGDIDFLATDHAPHTIEEKKKGISGLTHLDTYGSFITWLMKEHGFSAEDVLRISSKNPGNFINKFTEEKFGEIREGFIGSFSIINSNKPIKISQEKLKTKSGWSPFIGVTFPGSVVATIIKGKIYAK